MLPPRLRLDRDRTSSELPGESVHKLKKPYIFQSIYHTFVSSDSGATLQIYMFILYYIWGNAQAQPLFWHLKAFRRICRIRLTAGHMPNVAHFVGAQTIPNRLLDNYLARLGLCDQRVLMLLLPASEYGFQFAAQQKGMTAHQIPREEVRILAAVQRCVQQKRIIVGTVGCKSALVNIR